ncbi:hypothetical protein GLW08_16965 [Pontibacillus yanchengensis]|uniref:Uncharacterized protein n=2 Tax=Pontibacillus yanchengensis TaxID=462910 RepID=A0ACC7VJ98_9BACI|nr:hypothetical protein [Pontibacillus yanchengensis]MYL32632.1 hypothetical protein [Pontibacillus yanchengensis]MYL55026.1 hypothetical protein [Pontibacillus yanchengensis]
MIHNKQMFFIGMFFIGVLSFFTGELVTFVMLFLILISLDRLNQTIERFYHDWKENKNPPS